MQLALLLALSSALVGSPRPDGAEPTLTFTASLEGDSLDTGSTVELVVTLDLPQEIAPAYRWPDGLVDSDVISRPFLLLQTPPFLRAVEGGPPQLTTPADFQASFLHMLHGRLLEEKETRIAFRVTRKPDTSTEFGVNVVAHFDGEEPEDARFLRRRAEVPIRLGGRAEAEDVQATVSTWGRKGYLAIGDDAPDFELPTADDTRVALSDFRGQDVLLVVYRRET